MDRRNLLAIVDIGSNSVRLVVYSGAERVPRPVFNEKVLAGLGRAVGETGEISEESWACAISMLQRFKLLLKHMRVRNTQVVATAAVRDASNGRQFVHAVRKIGFDCRVITADEEARLAGEGVLAGIPTADGIVGDLGGGSLELVEVSGGRTKPGISLPLGVLRLADFGMSEKGLARTLRSAFDSSGMAERACGRGFYMVGGSWRALAKIDMTVTNFQLPITHGYTMAPERAAELRRILDSQDARWRKLLSPARLASTPAAAMLLEKLVRELRPRELVVSAFGIREGLLYSSFPEGLRRKDPLIEAAREAGEPERRFGEHGDVLDAWLSPLFDDSAEDRRIRRAACLLADVAWQANPEFRAERGIEIALHGNWVGVTVPERVMMAQALAANFGCDKLLDGSVTRLCSEARLQRARLWGLAMRLGQRLSGGVGSVLQSTRLVRTDGAIELHIPKAEAALIAEPVTRRMDKLARALGSAPQIVVK